jgi:hypothetical protein
MQVKLANDAGVLLPSLYSAEHLRATLNRSCLEYLGKRQPSLVNIVPAQASMPLPLLDVHKIAQPDAEHFGTPGVKVEPELKQGRTSERLQREKTTIPEISMPGLIEAYGLSQSAVAGSRIEHDALAAPRLAVDPQHVASKANPLQHLVGRFGNADDIWFTILGGGKVRALTCVTETGWISVQQAIVFAPLSVLLLTYNYGLKQKRLALQTRSEEEASQEHRLHRWLESASLVSILPLTKIDHPVGKLESRYGEDAPEKQINSKASEASINFVTLTRFSTLQACA